MSLYDRGQGSELPVLEKELILNEGCAPHSHGALRPPPNRGQRVGKGEMTGVANPSRPDPSSWRTGSPWTAGDGR